jgi:hypothetical protein
MSVAGKTTVPFRPSVQPWVTNDLELNTSWIRSFLNASVVVGRHMLAQRFNPHYIRIQIEFHQLLADILADRQLETDGAKRKQN